MKAFHYTAFCLFLALAVPGAVTAAWAQGAPPAGKPAAQAAPAAGGEKAGAAPAETAAAPAQPPFRQSLLFSELELSMIEKAASGIAVRSVTDANRKVELIPVDRKIWLSGIFYRNPQEWIVWLNGYKLWPGNLLPEIQGIKVEREQVHLEWYDIGKNGIINITLRPHQIYDIVTGLLLYDTDGGAPPSSGGRGRRVRR